MKFRKDMIQSIHESRMATKEEISQIHAITNVLIEFGIEQIKHNKLVEELFPLLRGSEGKYTIDYPGCHPLLLTSGIYDYLQVKSNNE